MVTSYFFHRRSAVAKQQNGENPESLRIPSPTRRTLFAPANPSHQRQRLPVYHANLTKLRKINVGKFASVSAVLAVFLACFVLSKYSSGPPAQPDVPSILKYILKDRHEVQPLRDAPAIQDDADEEPLGETTTFLLGIFSTLSETERRRRDLIRETYLSSDVGAGHPPGVCSLPDYEGLPPDARRSGCRVVYAFVVGANADGPAERVREDSGGGGSDGAPLALDPKSVEGGAGERDVVHLNIRENMEDGKTPTWFAYGASLSERYGVDYVAKTDSDTQLNVGALVGVVRRDLPPAPHNRRTYGGRPLVNFFTSGSYMAGAFYFVSSDLARYVTRVLSAEQRKYLSRSIEDLDFGSFVSTHPKPINKVDLSNYMFWYHPLKPDSDWQTMWKARKVLHPTHRERTLIGPAWIGYVIRFSDWITYLIQASIRLGTGR